MEMMNISRTRIDNRSVAKQPPSDASSATSCALVRRQRVGDSSDDVQGWATVAANTRNSRVSARA